MLTIRRCCLGVVALLASQQAQAQDAYTADLTAQGQTAVANPRDPSTATVNPANIALTDRYDVFVGFQGGPSKEWRWQAAAIDGRTTKYVSYGITYQGSIVYPSFAPAELPAWSPVGDDPINKVKQHDITFSLAAPFLDRKLSIGLNGTLSLRKGEFVDHRTTGNMDIGISTHPIEYLTIGFVAMNFLPVPDQYHNQGAIAFGVHGGKLNLISGGVEFQYRYEDVQRSPWVVRAGLEGVIKEIVALRAGYNWDGERGNHMASWGLGLLAKKMGSLSYAMQIPAVKGLLASQLTHTLTFTIYTDIGKRQQAGALNWSPRSQDY